MLRRLVLYSLIFVSTVAVAQTPQGSAKRPFTFEDMMALKRVGDPQVSPDGKWVSFSAVEVNLDANTRTPHIWIVPLSGGEAKQLFTSGPGEDRPRFSPDGKKLAFTSSRDGGSQVWLVDFDTATGTITGEPKKITNISTEASGHIWSPDGKNILFTSEVYADCPDDACNKQRDEELKNSKVKAKIFTHLLFRHWTTFTELKRTHIFVQLADGSTPARDLTPGDHDAPPFSLGGQDMYAFSPDGQEVAFTSNIDEVPAISTNNEIFIVPVSGGTPKKISNSPGSDSTPLYSPDGKYIAWRMQKRGGYESDRFRLVIYDRKSGEIRNLTEDFDRWVGSFVWAPDSKKLFFTAENYGLSDIREIDLELREVANHTGDLRSSPQLLFSGYYDDLAITPDGSTLVFTGMAVTAPNEIYSGQASPSDSCKYPKNRVVAGQSCVLLNAKKLTHLNDSILSQVSMQPLESFWFTSVDKAKVQGFMVKPPNFDPKKKYPVKFLIHGGPEGAWGDSWSYRWNPELFAANGYVIIMINPRGSVGYGQAFVDGVNGDWGGKPYQDLMLGLDYAEKTYPFIDKDRECALGASYGGYMANWILGNTTRFKCVVSHDGMYNSESAWGTTEELWFNEWEYKGTPWTNRELYRKWSPHLRAAYFKTPTLVVHGQLDYRLDVSEGFQLFTTLQRLKVPSKMLYFPDEGHWVLKPQNSRLWYKTVNDWVDQWTKPVANTQ